jgi:hypothetical protein
VPQSPDKEVEKEVEKEVPEGGARHLVGGWSTDGPAAARRRCQALSWRMVDGWSADVLATASPASAHADGGDCHAVEPVTDR